MPVARCFIDTNVLLYSTSLDPVDAVKCADAQRLLTSENWGWSAQVAAEFINASTSSRRSRPLSLTDAEGWIVSWLKFPMTSIDSSTVKEAIQIARSSMISYYDAQILAAAKQLGCLIVYTEDLNHGQNYAGVRAVNPFLSPPP